VTFGLVAGIAYAVFVLLQQVGKVGGAAANWTASQIADLALWWSQLTASPPMSVPGNVNLPNGQSFPVSSLTLRNDTQGNVYFQTIDGSVWQIASGSDASGNWSASIVPPPNFGVTGAGW
jgi:hypothetical protein